MPRPQCVKINNNAIPGEWKKVLVVPIYGGGEIERYLENNLGDLQATGARYSKVTKTSVGKVWMVIWGSA